MSKMRILVSMENAPSDTTHENKEREEKSSLISSFIFPVLFLLLLWIIEGSKNYFRLNLIPFGIYPRSMNGLIGVITAPLIHGDVKHLINNSIPLIVLTTVVFYFYTSIAWELFFWNYFTSGFLLWVAGRESYHVGASTLIYCFASFIFFSGLIRSYYRLMALSLLVVFLYGSMVWGILPVDPHISWEGHLFGAIAGLYFAFQYRKEGPQREKFEWETESDGENGGGAGMLTK